MFLSKMMVLNPEILNKNKKLPWIYQNHYNDLDFFKYPMLTLFLSRDTCICIGIFNTWPVEKVLRQLHRHYRGRLEVL